MSTTGKLHYTSVREGFLLIPRRMLKEAFNTNTSPLSEAMAFLLILYICNYSDGEKLKRGETDLTLEQWCSLFHWSRWNTAKFIKQLIGNGELSVRHEGKRRILRVTHYEEICGIYAAHPSAGERARRKKTPTQTELFFERFWEHYHEINHEIIPADKELAWKEWRKLTPEERTMAYENIDNYYLSMKDIHHSKKAYNYLRHRSFLI